MIEKIKVKLDLSKIQPVDEEEKEFIEAWNGEEIELPKEILEKIPPYKGEKNVVIFKKEEYFKPEELISVSLFAKNPSKYLKLLEEGKVEKLAILKNNKITAVLYPFHLKEKVH